MLDDVKCQSLTTRTIALNMSCNKNATFYFTKKNDRCDFFFFYNEVLPVLSPFLNSQVCFAALLSCLNNGQTKSLFKLRKVLAAPARACFLCMVPSQELHLHFPCQYKLTVLVRTVCQNDWATVNWANCLAGKLALQLRKGPIGTAFSLATLRVLALP